MNEVLIWAICIITLLLCVKNATKRKFKLIIVRVLSMIMCITVLFFSSVCAHPGRTDSKGGHYDHSTGEYHLHTGEHAGKNSSGSGDSNNDKLLIIPPISSSEELKKQNTVNSKNINNNKNAILAIGIVFAVFLIIYFIGWLIDAKNTKRKLKEQLEKEKQFLEEKEDFVSFLNGRTLREVAGVPLEIVFVNGLPKDNNKSPFGNFTVYRTKEGKCYHKKEYCVPNAYPVHCLDTKHLRACSRCHAKREMPQWYYDYEELKKQSKKFQLDIQE